MLKPYTLEGRFESGFAEATNGKVCALVAIFRGPGAVFGLSIVIANEAGHNPVPLHWCHADNLEELQAHADALNAELFNLTPLAAGRIIASSMFNNRRRRPA